jgi:hypothetical protein
MPTSTYTALATWTAANSSSTSVDFQNIPSTMRDLIFIINAKSSDSGSERNLFYKINNDGTGGNYFGASAYGFTSGQTSGTFNSIPDIMYMPRSGDAFGVSTLQIMDYSATDKHKTQLQRFNTEGSPTDLSGMGGIRWASTAAINRVTFYTTSGAIAQGSTISLWGIAA